MSGLEFFKVVFYFLAGVIGSFVLWSSYASGNWELAISFLLLCMFLDVIIKYAIKNNLQKKANKNSNDT